MTAAGICTIDGLVGTRKSPDFARFYGLKNSYRLLYTNLSG